MSPGPSAKFLTHLNKVGFEAVVSRTQYFHVQHTFTILIFRDHDTVKSRPHHTTVGSLPNSSIFVVFRRKIEGICSFFALSKTGKKTTLPPPPPSSYPSFSSSSLLPPRSSVLFRHSLILVISVMRDFFFLRNIFFFFYVVRPWREGRFIFTSY